jgi:hypothetical protein
LPQAKAKGVHLTFRKNGRGEMGSGNQKGMQHDTGEISKPGLLIKSAGV